MKINTSLIKPNPFNERKTTEGVAFLVDQMKQRGFWGSLLARKRGSGYEIAFGERRLFAARKAGVKEIDLEVRELSDREMEELTTVENVQKEDVNPVERGRHLATYKKKYSASEAEMSKIFGISRQSIHDLLAVTELDAGHQKDVRSDKIGYRVAIAAQRIGGSAFVETVKEKRLTKDEVERIGAASIKNPEYKKSLLALKVHPSELEIKGLTKEYMSPDDLAVKLESTIERATEAVDLIKDNWDKFSAGKRSRLNLAMKNLVSRIQRIGSQKQIK